VAPETHKFEPYVVCSSTTRKEQSNSIIHVIDELIHLHTTIMPHGDDLALRGVSAAVGGLCGDEPFGDVFQRASSSST
jgi:hypothetical protein